MLHLPSQSLMDAANDVIDSVRAQKRLKPPPPPKDNVSSIYKNSFRHI